MAMDDDMQTFRQKTGRKSGCHGCIYADWDADAFCGKMNGEIATISDCSDRKCAECILQWLRKEAEP